MASSPSQARAIPLAAWFTLAIFIVLYLLSFFDRQILSLVLIPIQQDLGLDDVQLGLVHGLAFSLFYATIGLALGWAIDRFSKKWLLFGGVVIWSLATVACGLVDSFNGLFAARVFVGFGEAVVAPAAMVVLTSIFPRERLGLVMGVYASSTNVGAALVFIAGGAMLTSLNAAGGATLPLVGALQPWQATFVIVGAPGLLLAFLAFFIVEPKRSVSKMEASGLISLGDFLCANHKIVLIHLLAFALMCMNAYCLIAWAPTYLGRTFAWTPLEIGLLIGLSNGLMGLLGNVMWGSIADWQTRRGHTDGVYRAYLVALLIGAPVGIATFLIPHPMVAIIGICASWLLFLGAGPMHAVLGIFVPAHLRGRVSAIAGVGVAVLAIGLTPLLIGGLTENVFQNRQMVGASIATVIAVCSVLAWLLLYFGRMHLREAIARNDATVT